jgi:hypothetical protein
VQSVFRLALDLRRAIRACLRWPLHLGRVLAPPADLGAVEVRSPRLVGYARVSTDEQTTTLQFDALRSAGCAVIREDSVSGASRSRPGLKRAIDELAGGDTLVVWKLDRLGRSLKDLLDGNGGLKLTPWRREGIDPSTAFKERFGSHLPPSREIAIGALDGDF